MDKPNDVELKKFALEQAVRANINTERYGDYYDLANMFYKFLKEK